MGMDFLEQNKDDIINLYNNGMFQREIADIYNTSSNRTFAKKIRVFSW